MLRNFLNHHRARSKESISIGIVNMIRIHNRAVLRNLVGVEGVPSELGSRKLSIGNLASWKTMIYTLAGETHQPRGTIFLSQELALNDFLTDAIDLPAVRWSRSARGFEASFTNVLLIGA
jgi:hypothetical protein